MIVRIVVLLAALLVADVAQASTRIKDIASVQGVRDNHLVGYGLVVGLQGTGDTLRNAQFTEQSLQSMLDRMGINVRDVSLRTRNVAAVIVTANLPPLANTGSRIDVNVTSLGDATSLKGGTLILTSLLGADGQVYAVAQGSLAVAGFRAAGQAETLSEGITTAARIPNGALIEREIPGVLREQSVVVLELKNPDYRTAIQIADAINDYGSERFRRPVASARDFRSIVLQKPREINTTRFVAEIGDLLVRPDTPARIVIDQKTGTVVIGRNVQISTVAMTHGNITVRVTEMPEVSQPEPFSRGETVVVPRTQITTEERESHVSVVRGPDLQTLVKGLNQIGLKPADIISILQAVKTAGALQAELIAQ